MAAVLACGEGAVLSHGHAVALHELRQAPSTAIDVTAPQRRRVSGIRCHWARTLDPADTTTIDGIPVTTVARALLDQAERLHSQRLRTLLEETLRREVFDLGAISATIDRNAGRRGIRPLRDAIATLSDIAPLLGSGMAAGFLELVREHGLPEPLTEQYIEGELVDFWWPQSRLIVEVDGWEFHRSHEKFEADRRKDAKHQAAGYRVLRYTWQRIQYEAAAVAAEVRAVLRLGISTAAA